MSLRSPLSERTKTGKVAGVAKKSAARAKPARGAAASVRVVKGTQEKSSLMMTREEKRAAREARREADQRHRFISSIILKNTPAYRSRRIIWGVLMGIALLGTVVSIVTLQVFSPEMQWDLSTPVGVLSAGSIIVAYVALLAVFIFDLVMIRPLRNQADAAARALTPKKAAALEKEYNAKRLSHGKKKNTD